MSTHVHLLGDFVVIFLRCPPYPFFLPLAHSSLLPLSHTYHLPLSPPRLAEKRTTCVRYTFGLKEAAVGKPGGYTILIVYQHQNNVRFKNKLSIFIKSPWVLLIGTGEAFSRKIK